MVACRICGARDVTIHTEAKVFFVNRDVVYTICGRCGSMQHNQALSQEDLSMIDIYGSGDYAEACSIAVQKLFRDGPLVRHMDPGVVFSIEVNDGNLASAWMHRGWEANGSSLSKISAARAESLGVKVVVGDASMAIEQLGVDNYDAAISDTGYCRFPSPMGEIRRVVSKVRPGGALVITGPNPQSAQLLSGDHPELNIFNQTIPSLTGFLTLANQAGLALVERSDSGPSFDLMFVKVK